MKCIVNFEYDDEAGVWTAYSDDAAGLVLEDSSLDALEHRVRLAIPELLEMNGGDADGVEMAAIVRKHEAEIVNG